MSKENDVPKDLPILKPAGRRPSLAELADTGAEALQEQLKRALPGQGHVKVAAFNSSI